ncbi:DNA polymerase III subunit beta [Pelagibacteraceae bacterium]|jgi:DNA polymerase-3 subunit beta|nr:DNA polymerase III subunit beta [Pelagibacteraceae bacterium]|tara:strand:- start:221 stop:1348 length:1128 start_codon:yes stop_codon:yes gene_type:complete
MEIKANSSDLLKALNHIHGIVEVRHTLPILSNIVLSAENNELSLSSTNLDIFCSDKIDAEIVNSGEISVPAITFFEIVKRLPSGSDVILSMGDEDTELILKCGRSKFNLSTLRTEDFPILSDKDLSTNFVISADELSRMIDKTKFAISNEETRYYLNGIFFHKAESNSIKFLRAVATDGHRLAQYDIPLPQGAEEITGIIIPKKTVFELRKVLDDADGDVSVSLNENKIKFSFNNLKIISKVIDGTFPDYTKVIPQNNDKKFKTNNSELKNAIDRVSAVAINEETKSKAIKLTIENNKLNLSVESQSKGSAKEEIDISYSNEKVDIGFNSRYLLDICNEVDGDEIDVNLLDSISPAIILDKTDENLFFVLMPMRI